MGKTFKERLSNIKCFIFDVDGVFTDGSVTVYENGEQVRKMNIKDGYAVQYAVKQGYRLAIISGGTNEGVRQRFLGLGLEDVYLGKHDKTEAFEEIKSVYGFKNEEILYVGDDMPDIPVMTQVGLACCPADAAREVQDISTYISNKKGGEGCIRDIIEQVLKAQGNWHK